MAISSSQEGVVGLDREVDQALETVLGYGDLDTKMSVMSTIIWKMAAE